MVPVGGNRRSVIAFLQLSATDVSARTTMKGAAKCDKHCELQNSVNQQNPERILRSRDIPEGMLSSVSAFYYFHNYIVKVLFVMCVNDISQSCVNLTYHA